MKLLGNFLLFLIAVVLFLPFSIINMVLVVWKSGKPLLRALSGYFRSTAISIDKYANVEFRTLWNATLVKEAGYPFGSYDETISSVLGKNLLLGELSKTGRLLAQMLDFLDENHCVKSIKKENKCRKKQAR